MGRAGRVPPESIGQGPMVRETYATAHNVAEGWDGAGDAEDLALNLKPVSVATSAPELPMPRRVSANRARSPGQSLRR